jgi:hypothetical protein|tara:strand:- start:695 stop:889 length:195 start_codon:yes stop_codon:yes gene_type:complete
MNKEEKIDKIMGLVKDKSSLGDDQLAAFNEVLKSLDSNTLNKLVAGVVFAEKPFKSKKKIWRIE